MKVCSIFTHICLCAIRTTGLNSLQQMTRMQGCTCQSPANCAGPAPDIIGNSDKDAARVWSSAGMRCHGCAAKVDAATLASTLASLGATDPPSMHSTKGNAAARGDAHGQPRDAVNNAAAAVGAWDDAAVIPLPPPGHVQLQTVDFLSACVSDAYLFGRIAAVHAMSDCFAMGARPVAALATAQVPHGVATVQAESLQLMMSGALHELRAASCSLAGGHTCTGAELALGLTVTGHAEPAALMLKSGLRAGQLLVLTKPLGTGVVLRGSMLMRARAEWLERAWRSMAQSNGSAADVLVRAGVTACTDVTGFGLLGHALEMAAASGVRTRQLADCAVLAFVAAVLLICPVDIPCTHITRATTQYRQCSMPW
jgi:selenide, water dikinase